MAERLSTLDKLKTILNATVYNQTAKSLFNGITNNVTTLTEMKNGTYPGYTNSVTTPHNIQ